MGAKIECPLCRKVHKNWQTYAEHLLESHTEDEDRCQWVASMIELSGNNNKPSEPEKVRGKPVNMIPPTRELPKKIPDYIKRQIGG